MQRRSPSRAARLAGAFCLFLAASLGGLGPADAQGWFGGIFGGGSPGYQQSQPNFPGYNYGGPSQSGGNNDYVPRHHARKRPQAQTQRPAQHEAAAPAPDKPAPPKKNASAFVYVFGDSFGQFLANGLDDALADRQDVAIVHKARGPTGLVTQSYFDWPKTIDTLLAGKDKIDVAVMMIGSNDRQSITQDGKTYDVGSDDWKRIYTSRVSAIDEAFRKKGIPLIWVGVPIAKNADFADTMAMLNDIYRDAAAKTGTTYVDTWGAFSDDNGDFAAYGPDIDGQTVRLRSADGILFTHAGARKLAHFVEAPVRRALDGKAPPPVLPTGTPDAQAQDKSVTDAKSKTTKAEPAPKAGGRADRQPQPGAGRRQRRTRGADGLSRRRRARIRWPRATRTPHPPAAPTMPAGPRTGRRRRPSSFVGRGRRLPGESRHHERRTRVFLVEEVPERRLVDRRAAIVAGVQPRAVDAGCDQHGLEAHPRRPGDVGVRGVADRQHAASGPRAADFRR